MALGATREDMLWMVMRMGLQWLVGGLALGLLASVAATRIIASQIWSVSPQDPTTLIGVVVILVLVGLAACYVPARRATIVDPMIALKCE